MIYLGSAKYPCEQWERYMQEHEQRQAKEINQDRHVQSLSHVIDAFANA